MQLLKPKYQGKKALINSKDQVEDLKNKLDKVCNEVVKLRDNRTCQRCGSCRKKMDWAHFHGRGKWAIRWDLDNSLTLCSGCHRYLDTQARGDFEELMLKRLGRERYDRLTLRRYGRFKLNVSNLSLLLRHLEKVRDGMMGRQHE